MRLEFAPYLLNFKLPAGTSRGVLTEKPTFLIKVYDENQPEHFGIGEAAVFPGLSPEADGNYVWKLTELLANVAIGRETDLSRYSSIQFGFEQALLDFSNCCKGCYFPSEFTKGKDSIEINGLIWMGNFDAMMERIEDKINDGFKCIKIKIGSIAWEKELEMIRSIRQNFGKDIITIRVDANGAFTYDSCFPKLEELAKLEVHSIEQPIKAGHLKEMKVICKDSPVPVALDEELIGKGILEEKERIIEEIRPQYLVLKPALCGGFSGASEWIKMAEENGIGWWITSALESNVGLNALAQYVTTLHKSLPQGLGTGNLFVNNFEVPLYLKHDKLEYNPEQKFDYNQFKDLKWHR